MNRTTSVTTTTWADDLHRADPDAKPAPAVLGHALWAEPTDPVPLSVMQQRMWFMEAMLEDRTTFNICSARKLFGPLDVAALERALNQLVSRHDALRTLVRSVGDHAAEQYLQPQRTLHLQPIEDFRAVPEPDRQAQLDRRLSEIAHEPLNLATGPLFECLLFRLGDEEHLLLFKVHHLVFDGWSMAVVLRDLGQLYAAQRPGTVARLPEPTSRYGVFVARHGAWLGPEAVWRRVEWSVQVADRVGAATDARALAQASLGALLSETTRFQIERAADGAQALTLLLMAPEFQRR